MKNGLVSTFGYELTATVGVLHFPFVKTELHTKRRGVVIYLFINLALQKKNFHISDWETITRGKQKLSPNCRILFYTSFMRIVIIVNRGSISVVFPLVRPSLSSRIAKFFRILVSAFVDTYPYPRDSFGSGTSNPKGCRFRLVISCVNILNLLMTILYGRA